MTLSDRKYSCEKWSIYRYLYSYVLAMCQKITVHFSRFMDDAYTVAAYMNAWSDEFYPLPHEDYWRSTHIFTCILDYHQLRPKQKERPKSIRLWNEMDDR